MKPWVIVHGFWPENEKILTSSKKDANVKSIQCGRTHLNLCVAQVNKDSVHSVLWEGLDTGGGGGGGGVMGALKLANHRFHLPKHGKGKRQSVYVISNISITWHTKLYSWLFI